MIRIILAMVFLFTGVCFGAPLPDEDPWAVEPGWATKFEFMDDLGPEYTLRFYDGDTWEIAGRETMVIFSDFFGVTLNQSAGFYSRNEEGDLFFHGSLNLVTSEASVFDPPLLYLDLPLEVGKSWEVDCRVFDNFELEGESEREHLIMTVAKWDAVATPAGVFPAWNTTCEVLEGNGMGTDWFAPGVGHVRMSAGQDGPLMQAVDHSLDGPWSLAGMGKPVRLDFNWEPGKTIQVEKYASKIKTSAGETDTIRVYFGYNLEFNRLPNGYLVHMADLDFGLPPEDDSSGSMSQEELIAKLSKAMPDFIINRQGEYQGLSGAGKSLEATFDFLAEAMGEYEEEGVDTQAILDNIRTLMTPEVYEAVAAEEWNKLIGTWVGLEEETGVMLEGSISVPVPMLQGREVPLDFLMAVAETCPCQENDREENCVRLVFSSQTDAAAVKEVVAELFQQFGGEELEGPNFDSLDVRTTIQAIMEPETMKLHEVHFGKRVKVEVTGPDGEAETGEQYESEWYYFTYPE